MCFHDTVEAAGATARDHGTRPRQMSQEDPAPKNTTNSVHNGEQCTKPVAAGSKLGPKNGLQLACTRTVPQQELVGETKSPQLAIAPAFPRDRLLRRATAQRCLYKFTRARGRMGLPYKL